MKCEKARKNLAFLDVLVIEKHRVVLQHFYGNEIYLAGWRRPLGSWQINPNALHVGLAQAHHHKAGKQEEHDIDQWNNFDARSFMRNWRQ